jgi:hypothetical protein
MARFDEVVDHEATIGYRTVPNVMIPLAMSDQAASLLNQDHLHAGREIIRHTPDSARASL